MEQKRLDGIHHSVNQSGNTLQKERKVPHNVVHEGDILGFTRFGFFLVHEHLRHFFQFLRRAHEKTDRFVVEDGVLLLHLVQHQIDNSAILHAEQRAPVCHGLHTQQVVFKHNIPIIVTQTSKGRNCLGEVRLALLVGDESIVHAEEKGVDRNGGRCGN